MTTPATPAATLPKSPAATYTAEQIMENRRLWAAALRSGRYEQCRSALHGSADGYCCIGVAVSAVLGIDVPVVGDHFYERDETYGDVGQAMDCSTTQRIFTGTNPSSSLGLLLTSIR